MATESTIPGDELSSPLIIVASFSEADSDLTTTRYVGLSLGPDARNSSITSFLKETKLPQTAKEVLDFYSIEGPISKPTSAPQLPTVLTSARAEPRSGPNQLT